MVSASAADSGVQFRVMQRVKQWNQEQMQEGGGGVSTLRTPRGVAGLNGAGFDRPPPRLSHVSKAFDTGRKQRPQMLTSPKS